MNATFAVKMLNLLEVIDFEGGEHPAVWVEDGEEFQAVCRALNISEDTVAKCSDDAGLIDILALGNIAFGVRYYSEKDGLEIG